MGFFNWEPYVTVEKRKELAAKKVKKLQKKGEILNPIIIEGRGIAKTFWGKAWCNNLENYSDYASRLPRGRTYVRSGAVIDLQLSSGKVKALVMGSSLYSIDIEIKPMPIDKWQALIKACSGEIDSLIELLQGKFSKAVMSILIDKKSKLFPSPNEIYMSCNCPDYAKICKHIAAAFYGIGVAIDTHPEWLFTLRHVDHLDLIKSATVNEISKDMSKSDNIIKESDIAAIFDIEID